jgi:nitrogenase subunit NifH
VIVTENGRRRSISKQEALVLHLVNKAVSGDRRLLQLLLDEVHVIEARAESSAVVDDAPNETDLRVFRQLHERIRRQLRKGEASDESNDV